MYACIQSMCLPEYGFRRDGLKFYNPKENGLNKLPFYTFKLIVCNEIVTKRVALAHCNYLNW